MTGGGAAAGASASTSASGSGNVASVAAGAGARCRFTAADCPLFMLEATMGDQELLVGLLSAAQIANARERGQPDPTEPGHMMRYKEAVVELYFAAAETDEAQLAFHIRRFLLADYVNMEELAGVSPGYLQDRIAAHDYRQVVYNYHRGLQQALNRVRDTLCRAKESAMQEPNQVWLGKQLIHLTVCLRALFYSVKEVANVRVKHANGFASVRSDTTDLHGQAPGDVADILDRDYAYISGKAGVVEWSIITGRGAHTADGVCRVKAAALEWLAGRSLRPCDNGGDLLVQLHIGR